MVVPQGRGLTTRGYAWIGEGAPGARRGLTLAVPRLGTSASR